MLQAFKYWYHIQSSSNILLREALAVSQNLHEERIFTWFSFFSSLCKLVNVKPSDVTLETFVLLKEKEFLAIRRAISLNETFVLFC